MEGETYAQCCGKGYPSRDVSDTKGLELEQMTMLVRFKKSEKIP